MNSYISHRKPRDCRPTGYVTSRTVTSQPTGYVTNVPNSDHAGSYIDAGVVRPSTLLLEPAR